MRSMSIVAGALTVLLNTSCGGGGPSGQEIDNSLETILRSVAGEWIAVANPPNPNRLEFRLQEGGDGQVSGVGTYREASTSGALPITVTGTFRRPVLTLAIDGMVHESRAVKGVIQGSYTTVGGITTTLSLTAPGYASEIPILLQEK